MIMAYGRSNYLVDCPGCADESDLDLCPTCVAHEARRVFHDEPTLTPLLRAPGRVSALDPQDVFAETRLIRRRTRRAALKHP